MEKKSKTWIIVVVVCLVMLLPMLIGYFSKARIKEIAYDRFLDIKEEGENALIYVGDLSDESYDGIIDILNDVDKEGTKSDYASDYSIYSIDSTDLTKEELLKLGTENGYIYIISGDVQKIVDASTAKKTLVNLVDAYYNATFNDDNSFFKVAKNASAYEKLVDSKDITVAVFGRNSCYYCNIFKPVYNAVAEKYDLDIYYFDSDNYDSKEYQKIMKLGLKIPASCNSDGKESLLSDGFGTPLTIFTKNGKTVDCISGYVDRDTLISKLVINDLIKE